MFRKLILIALVSVTWSPRLLEAEDSSLSLLRQKRNLPLVFPEGGTFKLLLCWGIPIKNPVNIALIFAYNIQYQYLVPPNITFFNKYYPYVSVAKRRKRSNVNERTAITYEQDRIVFYKTMEKAMDGMGINGRQCLLRTICEAAETPIDHNGFMGELFHLLLSPGYDVVVKDFLGDKDNSDYMEARIAGDRMFNCRKLYPECPIGHGLFDMMTTLE